MKTFKTNASQGEISIRRIAALPANVKRIEPINGKFVVGHSETGHHHTMLAERAEFFEATDAPDGMRVLYAILDAPNELVHERNFDTHEPIGYEPGIFEHRIGREYDHYAELARQQAD